MIDLHTHSTVSDGSDRPERIPELAALVGCSAVALTDHDSLAGLPAARRRAEELGVDLVPGCEISCRSVGTGAMHVLVYFVDDDGGPLAEELVRLRDDRLRRNVALADRMAAIGLPVTYEEVVDIAGGEDGVGRPHFATALVNRGVVGSIQEAFDRYLGNGGPAYVPKSRLDATDVAELARASGGVAVLAHPFSLDLEPAELARTIGELAEHGFAGIEAIYGRYSPRQRRDLVTLADRFDLVATGGSDHHGTIKPDLTVGTGTGDLKVPDRVLERLAARRPVAA
ncbi:MAG TPA: PHP domain-containing protein [Acidimicrobiales bacterium]|nr:PHP domain-containing protein [Acidimicrobiales bacterium]